MIYVYIASNRMSPLRAETRHWRSRARNVRLKSGINIALIVQFVDVTKTRFTAAIWNIVKMNVISYQHWCIKVSVLRNSFRYSASNNPIICGPLLRDPLFPPQVRQSYNYFPFALPPVLPLRSELAGLNYVSGDNLRPARCGLVQPRCFGSIN